MLDVEHNLNVKHVLAKRIMVMSDGNDKETETKERSGGGNGASGGTGESEGAHESSEEGNREEGRGGAVGEEGRC